MKYKVVVLLNFFMILVSFAQQNNNDAGASETEAELEESIQEPVEQEELPANAGLVQEQQLPVMQIQAPKDTQDSSTLTIETETQEEEPEVEEMAVEKPVDYGEGVDTLTISGSGNWLLKRVWWEKGQSKFEAIKAVLEKIFDARMDFFFKRSAIDKDLNAFYLEIGFAQGELDEILQNLIEMIERQPEESINDAEREMLVRLQKHKKELEQLKQDIAAVAEIDNAIDSALTQMIDQINKCRKYEHEAWLRFKAIAQEIDDEKARELYYHMETLQENMQDVYTYLRGEFVQYFNDLLDKARDYMTRVKTSIATFKEQNIALEKRVEAAVTEQPIEEEQVVEEVVVKKPKKGFARIMAPIINFIKQLVKVVIQVVKRLFDAIMAAFRGIKPKKVAPVEEVVIVEPETKPVEPTELASEPAAEALEPILPAPEPQETPTEDSLAATEPEPSAAETPA